MAKRTNNDLLGQILQDLETILADQKKSKKSGVKQDAVLTKILGGPSSIKEGKTSGNVAQMIISLNAIIELSKKSEKVSVKGLENLRDMVSSLSSIMKDAKIDNDSLKSFNTFIETIGKVQQTIEGIHIGFFKSVFSMSAAKGRRLGRMVGKFYEAFFKELPQDDKDFKIALANFKALIDIIGSTPYKSLKMMSILLSPKDGQRIGGFFNSLIISINQTSNKQVKNAIAMVNAISKLLAVMVISLLAVVLIAVTFKSKYIIGGFAILGALILLSIGLIWMLNKISIQDEKGAVNIKYAILMAGVIVLLIAALTLALLVTILVAKNFRAKHIIGGFAILGALILLSIGLIWMLNKISVQDEKGSVNIKHAILMAGVVVLLITTLILSLMLCIYIVKKFDWKEILIGFGILLAAVALSIGIIWTLSKIDTKNAVKSFEIAVAALAVIGVAAAAAFIAVKMGEYRDEILEGADLLVAFVAGVGLIIFGLSKIDKEKALEGALVAAAVCGLLILLTVAVGAYIALMDYIDGISGESIAKGSGIVLAIIAGTTAIVFAASLCLSGPQAAFFALGVAAIGTISGVILMISAALAVFTKLLNYINESLDEGKIQSAFDILVGKNDDTGSVIGCLAGIVNGMVSKIGPLAALTAGFMAVTMYPLMKLLGDFIDLIVQVANLRYIKEYDDNGKPIYETLKPDVFVTASQTLATGFSDFVKILGDTFKDDSSAIKTVALICDQLCPKSGILSIFSGESHASFNDLLQVLGRFIDVIQQMANLKMVDHYDENGKPVYVPMDPASFKNAANNLVTGFSDFLSTLGNNGILTPDIMNNVVKICDQLCPKSGFINFLMTGQNHASISDLIGVLSQFVEVIEKMSSLQFIDHYDDEGKPVYVDHPMEAFGKAAKNIATGFATFLNVLCNMLKDTSDDIEDIVDDITDGDIAGLFTAVGQFSQAVENVGLGIPIKDKNGNIVKYKKIDWEESGRILAKGFSSFLSVLAARLEDESDDIEDIVDDMEDISKIFDATKKFTDNMVSLTSNKITLPMMIKTADLLASLIIDHFIKKYVANKTFIAGIRVMPSLMKMLEKSTKPFAESTEHLVDALDPDVKWDVLAKNADLINGMIVKSIKAYEKVNVGNYELKMRKLSNATRFIKKTMDYLSKTVEVDVAKNIVTQMDMIAQGIDRFVLSLNKQVDLHVRAHYDTVDLNQEDKIIAKLDEKANAFEGVNEKIKETNAQMTKLINLEKQWDSLSQNSMFTKMAKMMEEQANALKAAVDTFTAQVQNTTAITVDPASIAQGINQASITYTSNDSGKTFIKA